MKKTLLLILFASIAATVWSQPPPPPPPGSPTSGADAPIDTDVLCFILPAALFAVYRLNKKRTGLVNDLK
jgi:hypothetical protein